MSVKMSYFPGGPGDGLLHMQTEIIMLLFGSKVLASEVHIKPPGSYWDPDAFDKLIRYKRREHGYEFISMGVNR